MKHDGNLNDYFTLDKGKVMVKPGVTIAMGSGMQLEIESQASFYCVGSAAELINIRGFEATRGYWDKIRFVNTPSSANQISYTNISDGGGNGANIWTDAGMLTCLAKGGSGNTQIKITNTNLSNSATWGISFPECTSTTIINGTTTPTAIKSKLTEWTQNNTFSNNGSGDIYTHIY